MQIQRTLIELRGEAVGIAVQEQRGWRFYAAVAAAHDLDKHLFASPQAIEDACRKLSAPPHRFSSRFFTRDRDAGAAGASSQFPAPQPPLPEGGAPYGFPFAHY
jgi:hypothetical protein